MGAGLEWRRFVCGLFGRVGPTQGEIGFEAYHLRNRGNEFTVFPGQVRAVEFPHDLGERKIEKAAGAFTPAALFLLAEIAG